MKKSAHKKIILIPVILAFLFPPAIAQFSPEALKEMQGAEEFMKTARVAEYEQLGGRFAVTNPYKLTLEKNGRRHLALWKNAEGIMGGHRENWQWEVAAYRMDKLLNLNMVPPTVERPFQNDDGSCQYWVTYWINLAEKEEKSISVPRNKLVYWNRAVYLQRAFDNLIANVDRHMRNIFITKDWRMILIDHSRSFKTGKRYTRKLIYTEDSPEGNRAIEALPIEFFEKLKNLTYETLDKTMEYYLTDDEKQAVLTRRDLIVEYINRKIEEKGEHMVLYEPLR
jgi:hypothetical protein